MTTAAAPAAPKTKQTTEYVVLREQNLAGDAAQSSTVGYIVVGTFKATSASEAIKKAAGDKSGVYRAIPARSFKPVKVTVSTETKITLG